MLSYAVQGVNNDYPGYQRVWFIDPNEAYNGHRFCEDGVTEPDPARQDTWLFLSGWPDNSLPGTDTASISGASEADETIKSGPGDVSMLPDPGFCGRSRDWYDQMLCEMAKVASPFGPGHISDPYLADAVMNGEDVEGPESDVDVAEVPWYVATRSAKTFHPKTLGQLAFKELIMQVW